MAQTMSPSTQMPISEGQIDKAVALYRAMLIKHRAMLNPPDVQHVLGDSEFVGEMFGVLRRRAEAVSDLIVRRVSLGYFIPLQQILAATRLKLHVDPKAAETMPMPQHDDPFDVFFFRTRKHIESDEALDTEYDKRGLVPLDPYSLAKANIADRELVTAHSNATHWKTSDGTWCSATFVNWFGDRRADVGLRKKTGKKSGWGDFWWYAGVPK